MTERAKTLLGLLATVGVTHFALAASLWVIYFVVPGVKRATPGREINDIMLALPCFVLLVVFVVALKWTHKRTAWSALLLVAGLALSAAAFKYDVEHGRSQFQSVVRKSSAEPFYNTWFWYRAGPQR